MKQIWGTDLQVISERKARWNLVMNDILLNSTFIFCEKIKVYKLSVLSLMILCYERMLEILRFPYF